MKKKMVVLLLAVCMLIGCQAVAEETSAPEETAAQEVAEDENVTEVLEQEVVSKQQESPKETEDKGEIPLEEGGEKEETAGQEASADEVTEEEATEPEADTQEEAVNTIILSEERKAQIESGLYAGVFSASPILLEEVTAYLDEKGIHYKGFYTGGERADMTLEDGTTLLFLETENQDMIPFGYELIMVNDTFNQWSFQENYYHAYDVTFDQYYYPELSERVWKEEEFNGFSRTELSIARNELFAKYGRIFEDPFLNQVFSVKNWYKPKYTAEEFDGRWKEFLTDIEEQNLQTIIACEKTWRWRGANQGTKEVKELISGSFIDLNGDGIEEQIVYEAKEEGSDGAQNGVNELSLIVKSNGGETRVSLGDVDGYLFHENCFATSMDGQKYFLMVMDYGPSADYVSFIYGYENGELVEAGRMASCTTSLKVYEDRILAPTETCHLQCQPVDFVYVLQDGKFVHQPSEYYVYRGNTVTALRDYSLFGEKGDAEPTIDLKEGEEVKILGGDLNEWVLLEKVDTGEQGWLKVNAQSNDVWISEEEKVSCHDAFDGLYFYG